MTRLHLVLYHEIDKQLPCSSREDQLKSYVTIERRLFALLWLLLILDKDVNTTANRTWHLHGLRAQKCEQRDCCKNVLSKGNVMSQIKLRMAMIRFNFFWAIFFISAHGGSPLNQNLTLWDLTDSPGRETRLRRLFRNVPFCWSFESQMIFQVKFS